MLILALLLQMTAAAVVLNGTAEKGIPAGTHMEVRLKSRVATAVSRVNDPVEAVVIAPLIIGDAIIVPPGSVVKGRIQHVQAVDAEHPRAVLLLNFNELSIKDRPGCELSAQVVGVDNARESVDEKGQIVGILGSESISSRMDDGLQKLGNRFGGLAAVLQTAKKALIAQTNPEIDYAPGVEFTLIITKSLVAAGPSTALNDFVQPIQPEPALAEMVNSQPFQTMAENPPKPSDMTNLMFLGTAQEVQDAFTKAGWSAAAALDTKAKMETVKAIVEQRGHSEAPVSFLLLEGQKPDFVFEKLNNTFASRHHLRIWKRPGTFGDRVIWVCAATHDTGIDFSPENRTFIHKIDPQIDRERAKVVFDLLFTGLVKGLSLVSRPAVPQQSSNATGDQLITDGSMAVILF
jgi:hypothetical protein